MFGRSLFVTPHTPGTTRSRFRDVAQAAAKVFVVSELRIVFDVLFLDRTLAIRIRSLKRPPVFRVENPLARLVTMEEGATGQTVVILANVQEIRVIVSPLLTAPTPSVNGTASSPN